MIDFDVRYYDDYNVAHDSRVYYIDPIRDRFLVVRYENNEFYWVNTSECELITEDY